MKKKHRSAKKWAKLAARKLNQIADLQGRDPKAFVDRKRKARKYLAEAKRLLPKG